MHEYLVRKVQTVIVMRENGANVTKKKLKRMPENVMPETVFYSHLSVHYRGRAFRMCQI